MAVPQDLLVIYVLVSLIVMDSKAYFVNIHRFLVLTRLEEAPANNKSIYKSSLLYLFVDSNRSVKYE